MVPKLHNGHINVRNDNGEVKDSSIIQFIVYSRIERKTYIPSHNLYGLHKHKQEKESLPGDSVPPVPELHTDTRLLEMTVKK
jgi:hypothetical protein